VARALLVFDSFSERVSGSRALTLFIPLRQDRGGSNMASAAPTPREEVASQASPGRSPANMRSSLEPPGRDARRRDFVQYFSEGIGLLDEQDLQSKVRNSELSRQRLRTCS